MKMQNTVSTIESLEKRVKKLNFYMKFAVVGWIAAFSLAILFTISWRVDAEQENLVVRQLSIVDEKGTPRIILGAPKPDPQIDGKRFKRRSPSNGIQFNDENGDEVGGFGSLDDGSKTLCFDGKSNKKTSERICIFALPNGKTGFLVNDENGNQRANLGITSAEGHSDMALSDNKGNVRIRLRVGSDGSPKLEMFDEKGILMENKVPAKPARKKTK